MRQSVQPSPRRRLLGVSITALVLLIPSLTRAGLAGDRQAPVTPCDVPLVFPTVQEAIDDVSCTEVVMSAGTFAESVVIGRSLTLRGSLSGETVLEGRVRASGGGTAVALRNLTIDGGRGGCFPTVLISEGGAAIDARSVDVFNSRGEAGGECPIFSDGFETGDLSAWSSG